MLFESLRAVSNVYELELSDRFSAANSYTQKNPIYVRVVYIFGCVFTLSKKSVGSSILFSVKIDNLNN